jgi:hypothetical protein
MIKISINELYINNLGQIITMNKEKVVQNVKIEILKDFIKNCCNYLTK